MDKSCFIIMPISDVDPYPTGHFKRVYEHLIKPAVEQAGFVPVRADDILTTNYIAIDVLKRVINSDMALCDLSSRNPNVLYELGIRQAFNLPVTFIKDSITNRIFDIQGFRDIEYDQNLRVDNVQMNIESIAKTIENTYNTRKSDEVNSLVSLLGIRAAQLPSTTEISKDTAIILDNIQGLSTRILQLEQKSTGNWIDLLNNNISEVFQEVPITTYKELSVGDVVIHHKFGSGRISQLAGSEKEPIAVIDFKDHGRKSIMLNYASLKKLFTNKTS